MSSVVWAGEAKKSSLPRTPVYRLAILACATICPWLLGGAAAPDGGQNISGVWWATTFSPKIELIGGGELPYNAAGKAAYEKNIAALKSGEMTDAARRFCVPDGVPRILETPYPFEIVQTPGQITMVHELNHAVRVVTMDRPLPKTEDLIPYPYYNGHSAGRWEGNTLVLETAGFNDKTFLDATGAPHSDSIRTVERIRRIAPDQLEDVVTVHDPEMFTRDWSARFVYRLRNDVRIEDYVCGEKHRDISSVRGVQTR